MSVSGPDQRSASRKPTAVSRAQTQRLRNRSRRALKHPGGLRSGSVPHRPHPTVDPRDLCGLLRRDPCSSSPSCRKHGCAATGRGDSRSTAPRDVAPNAKAPALIKLEMSFLPPAFVRCEACGGCRFNRETLDIRYRGKNIAQVLEFSVEEALYFFASVPKIRRRSRRLCDTGPGLSEARPNQSHSQRRRGATGKARDPSAFRLAEARLFDPLRGATCSCSKNPPSAFTWRTCNGSLELLQRLVDAGH